MRYRKYIPWHWSRHGQYIPAHYEYPWRDAVCRWFIRHERTIGILTIGVLCMAWIMWLSHQPH